MSTQFDEVVEGAMKLPVRDRVRLAQRLVDSVDEEGEGDISELWQAVAERRLEELESGAVEGIDATEVFKKARQALKH